MKHKFSEAKIQKDENALVVRRESSDFVAGSDRMMAVGGGVRARVAKTKEGKLLVQEFLFDRDRFTEEKVNKWLEKNSQMIEESLAKVQENAPKGSFQDITMRLSNAVNMSGMFLDEYGNNCGWLEWVFNDFCVVQSCGEYYRIDYSETENGMFTLGQPVKADMEFVAKEAKNQKTKFERKMKQNCELDESIKVGALKEKDTSKREVVAVLIEAGTNYAKKRHYPKSTIQESAPLFAGLKMYLDHPTQREEAEKPERSLREWVATIVESWYEDGAAVGRIKVHSDWLWDLLENDPVFREHIGISINASGRRSYSPIQGQQMEVIEEIVAPKSVDWVTEPGARGRVLQLIESKRQKEEDKTMLKTVTINEVRSERPDLVAVIEGEVKQKMEPEIQARINTAVTEAKKPLETELNAIKESQKEVGKNAKIKELVEGSKLPAKAKEKLIESLGKQSFQDETKLVEAINQAVKDELAYLKDLGGIKIVGDEAEDVNAVRETVASPLLKRLGIKENKEEKK